jgi:hypothetical protein
MHTAMQYENPFSESESDRREIWEVLVRHDFEAFIVGDWSMMEPDFWQEGFSGIDARYEPDPLNWRLTFPSVASYRDEWLRQAEDFASVRLEGTSVLHFLYDSCDLCDVEINGARAIARKKFDGSATTTAGNEITLRFQSVYQMVRRNDKWLIEGFVGYLPNPMPANR